jgi:hypothetical protein
VNVSTREAQPSLFGPKGARRHRGGACISERIFGSCYNTRRWCPAFRAWADGLKPLQVHGAVYAGLKHQTPFDPTQLGLPQTA